MKDLISVPIALFFGLVVVVGAFFTLPMVVTEIQPVSEVLNDFTNRPTRTMEDNLGVATTIVGLWAIIGLIVITVLPSTVNIGSAIVPWSFRLIGRIWSRILGGQTFFQRLGSTIAGLWAIIVGIGRIVLVTPAHVFLAIVRWAFGPVGRGWRRSQNFRYRLGSVYGNRILHSLILFGSAFGVFAIIR